MGNYSVWIYNVGFSHIINGDACNIPKRWKRHYLLPLTKNVKYLDFFGYIRFPFFTM